MRSEFFAALIALTGLTQAAMANDVHPNLSVDTIRAQQQQIRADAESGKGRYKDMSAQQRSELFARQERVSAMLKDVQTSTDELDQTRQIELFNALESIEAIVNTAEDERMICKRSKPIGSNRPVTVCRTVAQLREEREAIERDTGRRTLECSEATMGPGGCRN